MKDVFVAVCGITLAVLLCLVVAGLRRIHEDLQRINHTCALQLDLMVDSGD